MIPNIFLILLLFQSQSNAGQNFRNYSLSDTNVVIYNNDDNLIVITHNADSLKFYKNSPYPNPFAPTIEPAIIILQDATFAKVMIKSYGSGLFNSFIWKSLPTGAYKFRWWEK